jgi:hypothetical protein
MNRRTMSGLFAAMTPGAMALLGCSTAASTAPPAMPVCGPDARLQGGFCVIAESVPEAGVAGGGVTLSHDVQRIFTRYCGVVGCHVPGTLAGQLNLAPGFAYDALVNAQPSEVQKDPLDGMPLFYVLPGDVTHSYLYIKVHGDSFNGFVDAGVAANVSTRSWGTQMPASGTNSALDPNTDLKTIDDWINGGALR